MEYQLGTIVELKKQHPCKKSLHWEVIRLGADIKVRCLGCTNIIELPRRSFDKSIKKIIKF